MLLFTLLPFSGADDHPIYQFSSLFTDLNSYTQAAANYFVQKIVTADTDLSVIAFSLGHLEK